MNYQGKYKLSWLELRKEIDSEGKGVRKTERAEEKRVEKERKGEGEATTGLHQQGSEHHLMVQVIRQKIPFLPNDQAGLCFTFNLSNHRNIQTILMDILQYEPLVCVKFYHSVDEGNVEYNLVKFNSLENSQNAYDVLSVDESLKVEWCEEVILSEMQRVCFPESPLLRHVIDALSQQVLIHGMYFERYLVKLSHPLLMFMNHISSEYLYYRWKVYSCLLGDSSTPFVIQENGPCLHPPVDYPSPKLLPHHKRILFSNLLLKLINSKREISRVMVFAIRYVRYSPEIAFTITETRLKSEEEFLVRMYLLSDIMHNSLALNYPGLFKVLLPNFLYRAVNTLQLTLTTKQKVTTILKVWKQLQVYEKEYSEGLEFTLSLTEEVVGLHSSLLSKSPEEIHSACLSQGLPTLGKCHFHLSKLLLLRESQSTERVENVYDGLTLSEAEIIRIKSQTVDVITYHSLNYLDNRRTK